MNIRPFRLVAGFLFALTTAVVSVPASAQTHGQYVTLPGVPGATKAVLWTPDTGTPHVALVLMHRTSNSSRTSRQAN